jgi:hypothetical protein
MLNRIGGTYTHGATCLPPNAGHERWFSHVLGI